MRRVVRMNDSGKKTGWRDSKNIEKRRECRHKDRGEVYENRTV